MLLDIGLHEVNDYEVARRLRADPATRDPQLVALAGFGRREDSSRGRL